MRRTRRTPASDSTRPRQPRWAVTLLCAIAAGYVAIGVLYALHVPLWQAPDEPSHYLYVRDVALTGKIPTVTTANFSEYEALQPPIYYYVLAPVYRLFEGSTGAHRVYALRIATLLLGLPLIPMTYAVTRRAIPQRLSGSATWIACAVTGLVTFVPQRIALYASIDNDVVAELAVTGALLAALWVVQRREPLRLPTVALLGVLTGVGLLGKLTALAGPVVLALAVTVRSRRDGKGTARTVGAVALLAAVTLGMMIPWFAHNVHVYGDLFGSRRHKLLWDGRLGTWATTKDHWSFLIVLTFKSFWALLGWVTWFASARIYWLAGALTMVGGTGAIVLLGRIFRSPRSSDNLPVLLCAVTPAVTLAWLLWFNLTQFWQPQGRYLFAALAGAGVVFVLGIVEWFPRRLIPAVVVGVLSTVLVLDVLVYTDVILKMKPYPARVCPGLCVPAPFLQADASRAPG